MGQIPKIFGLLSGLLYGLALGCAERNIDESFDFQEVVTHLDVNVDSANVTVEPSLDNSSFVDVDVRYRGSDPDYDVYVTGTTLKVIFDSRFGGGGDFVIQVPPEVLSRIDVDSGNVNLRGLDGSVTGTVDSGNIKVDDLLGNLDLAADSGTISGTVASETCSVDVDSGSVNLEFAVSPRNLDVVADSGNVQVHVPSGAYDIRTKVDSGGVELHHVTIDGSAPNSIRAEVDSGKITITGY